MLARTRQRQVFHVEKQSGSHYYYALEAGQTMSGSQKPENAHVNTPVSIHLSVAILLISTIIQAQPVSAQADEEHGRLPGNVMVAFVASLTEADMVMIADYHAAQDGLETLE